MVTIATKSNGKMAAKKSKSSAKEAAKNAAVKELFADSNLRTTLQQIEKSFGEGAIMPLGSDHKPIEGISTGSLSFDLALGGRGVPRGRIIEMFGPE